MAKGNAIVMYLEQARIHGEPIGVTRSEVLFTKPNGYTVQPHNRVVSKADNKTMGESFLNELIYVLGAEDGEERKLPYEREVLVYTSDEINSDNYRTYINAVNTGIDCPVHNFKLCQKLRRLCDERGYHLFFSNNSLLGSTIRNDAIDAVLTRKGSLAVKRKEGTRCKTHAVYYQASVRKCRIQTTHHSWCRCRQQTCWFVCIYRKT